MSQLQEKSGGGSTVVTEEPVAKSNKRGKKKEQKEQAPVGTRLFVKDLARKFDLLEKNSLLFSQ